MHHPPRQNLASAADDITVAQLDLARLIDIKIIDAHSCKSKRINEYLLYFAKMGKFQKSGSIYLNPPFIQNLGFRNPSFL